MSWDYALELGRKTLEHVVEHGFAVVLFTVVGLVTGWVLHWRRQHYYGTLLNVQVCIMEPVPRMNKILFTSDAIWEGLATDWMPNLNTAAILTSAVRRMTGSGLLKLPKKDAENILILCANQIRQRFPQGFLAKAMDDADVTQCTLLMGLFKDPAGSAPVTLLLITSTDWKDAREKAASVYAGDECRTQLSWAQQLNEENSVRIRMYM